MNRDASLPMLKQNQKTRKLNILIVDDEPGYRDLLTFQLNSIGLKAQAAQNAVEALQALNSSSYSLIVTDIRMPGGLDGIDFVEAYRKQKPDQKVIFITGFAEEQKLAEAVGHSSTRCLYKPFELNEFLLAVRQLLWSAET